MGEPEVKTDVIPEAEPAPTLHWKYNVGDIDLLSSDNTLFKVHKYQLMAAGAGFRDILTGPLASKIAEGEGSEVNSIQLVLVDKTIETERVVESFLDFLSSGSFSAAGSNWVLLVQDTLRFARKWQYTTTVRLLLDLSRLALLSQEVHKTEISPERFFALGAEHEDIALCAMAIEHAGGWQWTDEGKYVGGSRKGCSVMDPTAWDEDLFEINPRYYWALTVATNKESTDPSQADTERWKRIANKFEVVVRSKKREA